MKYLTSLRGQSLNVWLALFIIYSLIYGLNQPAILAQTDCVPFNQSQPNPQLANELLGRLNEANIEVTVVAVSTFGESCFNDQTDEATSFEAQATDFDLVLSVTSLTNLTNLGNLTAGVLEVLVEYPPTETPGAQPGEISLTFEQGAGQNYLLMGFNQAEEALAQNLQGEALMLYLGYQVGQVPTIIQIKPATLHLTTCEPTGASRVEVSQVTDLETFELIITFDPAVVQVVDADPNTAGVQVRSAGETPFGFIVTNEVNNGTGRINFAAAMLDIDGSSGLIEIDWQWQTAGDTTLTFERTDLADSSARAIEHVSQPGRVELASECDTVAGEVLLQGRVDHRGTVVSDALGQQTTTDSQGRFSFFGGVSVVASHPGYLTAMTDIEATDQPVQNVGHVTLLAGDVNGDNEINIFDLSFMATQYGGDNPQADLNADGLINIFDLSLAASNYDQTGPQVWSTAE